ncbi:MAG: riboflavin synthase subunit alpha [Chloroflexi bacterium RBG_13_54_9]|nr:MAG: riboflavin synthase subunit alpha [Chloroflexi bacterium RBG_13_54_9]
MFSGIIEEIGITKRVGSDRFTIGAKKVLEGTKLGDSIAVNGACLTVVDLGKGAFSVDVMPETWRLTNLGKLKVGDGVNLERALAVGDRVGGHFVQGHVEGLGRVLSLTPEEGAIVIRFSAPPEIMHYVVKKGFIAVDGISLTVIDCDHDSFSISLVAYTQRNTTLASKKPGDLVNIETDIMAKYVEHLRQGNTSTIDLGFLVEHGFVAGRESKWE